MKTVIQSSPIAGQGLFAAQDIPPMTVLFKENVWSSPNFVVLDDGSQAYGVSSAWALVLKGLRSGFPSFAHQLSISRMFLKRELVGPNKDLALMLMQAYPYRNVLKWFGIMLTNFFASQEHVWISPRACRINHNKTSNCGAMTAHPIDGTITWISSRQIKEGEEICFDYGGAYGELFE